MFHELESSGYESYIKLMDLNETISGFGDKNYVDSDTYFDRIKVNVDPQNEIPFNPELVDLVNLHYLCTSRNVITIMEFGCGYSTKIFDHALQVNKIRHQEYVEKSLRKNSPFVCHTLDNNKKWIKHTKNKFFLTNVQFHYSKVRMKTFNDRICTLFDKIPNICPDLIYIDGPSQLGVKGNVNGITTSEIDRLPMAADVLSFEHFLLPGCLIVIDGRAANARFLRANLQRVWRYTYEKKFDQHFFELEEEALGPLNQLQLNFSKGDKNF